MTNVLDMNKGDFTLYTLSPFDAVVAAYAQREKRNFNTWEYSKYYSKVEVFKCSNRPELMVVTCGNQTCLCPSGKQHDYIPQDYEIEIQKFIKEEK